MRRSAVLLFATLAALACAFGIHLQHRHAAHIAAIVQASQAAGNALPQQILWVWERPEDLRNLHPETQGAAVYQGTLHLGESAAFTPRRNPYLLPQNTKTVAVVRIETTHAFTHRVSTTQAIGRIAKLAAQPGTLALQIDFDARKSERAFYAHFLQQLREAIPPTTPLGITALVSWCDEDDWIGKLPVNSATPMFFRMEPGRARFAQSQRLSAHLPEPLCNTTAGVSTREPWPAGIANRHLYIFPDHGWQHDFKLIAALEQQTQ